MELGCRQTGSAWDGWGQEEPQAEQEVPVPFLLVWGALPHAPNTGVTEGQPLPPGLSVLLGAKLNSVPAAAFICHSRIWPLVTEGFGGERIEDRKCVFNNRVSLLQVKEPSLMQDAKLTLG